MDCCSPDTGTPKLRGLAVLSPLLCSPASPSFAEEADDAEGDSGSDADDTTPNADSDNEPEDEDNLQEEDVLFIHPLTDMPGPSEDVEAAYVLASAPDKSTCEV